jgi:hypothetical protein
MEETQSPDQEPTRGQPAPSYELSLTGPGMTIKRTVDEDVALRVITLVMGGAPAATDARSVPSNAGRPDASVTLPTNGRAAHSVGEFLSDVEAKRNPDKIVAFAVYLEDYASKKPFTTEDVRSQFPLAGEGIPANFSRDFKWAVSNRWIAAMSGSPNEFYVTNTGRKAIAAKFSDEFIKKTRLAPSRRRTKGKGAGKDAGAEGEAK